MTVFAPVFWAEFEKVDRKIHSVPEIVENPFHPPQPRPKTGRFCGSMGGFSKAFCGIYFTFCRRFVILCAMYFDRRRQRAVPFCDKPGVAAVVRSVIKHAEAPRRLPPSSII
jgi:hypothetical protein